jgi:hypothetical protein
MKQTQLIHPYIERVLRQIILKDLANKGRPYWDKPHTQAVVYWMKHLLQLPNAPKANASVLITAAYAHDWGYAGLFTQNHPITIDQARSQKYHHMKASAHKIERLIYQRLSSYFSETEILRLTHLVAIHDDLSKLKAEDEILLMECDTLGMLDVKLVKPTLSPTENQYFMKTSIYAKRLPLFRHQSAKKIATNLIKDRENYYQSFNH